MAKKFDLFIEKDWEKEWQDMPEFKRFKNEPYQQIIVSFRTKEDVETFAKLLDRTISKRTDSIWFPNQDKKPIGVFVDES